jgi:hypothetical protein
LAKIYFYKIMKEIGPTRAIGLVHQCCIDNNQKYIKL